MKLPSLPLASVVAIFAIAVGVGPVVAAEKSKPGITIDWGKSKDDSQNVDARYTPEGLRQAFAALCKSLRYRAQLVEIDQSEFPFLVYGVLEGHCDYKDIRDKLGSVPGYAYSGCFTAVKGDGAVTIFALNMIPREYTNDDPRRTMERLKSLGLSLR